MDGSSLCSRPCGGLGRADLACSIVVVFDETTWWRGLLHRPARRFAPLAQVITPKLQQMREQSRPMIE